MTKSDLRSRLIDETITMLAVDPDGVTLRGVARAAGVSAMAPYRHFADKAALMDATKMAGFAQLREAVARADVQSADDDALTAQGLAYIDFAEGHPALFRLMFTSPVETAFTPQADADTAYGVLARRVARMAPGHAATATTAAWSIVHGLAMLRLDGRLPPGQAHARQVLALFVRGLAAGASPTSL